MISFHSAAAEKARPGLLIESSTSHSSSQPIGCTFHVSLAKSSMAMRHLIYCRPREFSQNDDCCEEYDRALQSHEV
jgi:hypothetical protein